MPELPEVETIVRTLRPRLTGARITSAEFTSPLVMRHARVPVDQRIAGAIISHIDRCGKFIVFHVTGGVLVVHLGMTGQLLLDAPRTAYTRAVFELDRGWLNYDDIRQFGSIEWSPTLPARLTRLGPEPLEISEAEFRRRIAGHRASIKAVLLSQTAIRGLGNIYVDEALFRAGIRPTAIAAKLSRPRANRLHSAIQEVLSEAIHHGGSSISDYLDAEGRKGSFQDRHRVYAREGEPCTNCGAAIRRVVVAQRGTHYCPRCQR